MALSSASSSCCTCLGWSVLSQILKRTLCTSLEFFFCALLSPLWHSVLQTPSASSSRNQLCFLNSVCWMSLGLPFLHHGWETLQGSKLGNHHHRAHLIFLILRFHCLSLAGVHCLENYCFIYCLSLVVSGKEVDLVTVTSSWQEVEGGNPPPQPLLACS